MVNLVDVPGYARPTSASRRDPLVGRDELGREIRMARNGVRYLATDIAPVVSDGAGGRGAVYNLLDNIIGYDDDVVTPGERLKSGVQSFVGGLLSDPLGTGADIVRGGYETVEGAMGPRATPMDVLGAAGMAMGAGGLAARPAGSVGVGGRVVDFSERRRQQSQDEFLQRIQAVVDDVSSGNYQRRLDEAAFATHREGLLPLQMGTRVSPPETYEMPGNWAVSGYFVDPNNPRRFGYKLENESGETFDAVVSDPQIGYRLGDPTQFGGGFRAFAGPRAEALEYQNLPQAPQTGSRRSPTPDEQAQLDEEYRQLFGDDLSANRSTTTGSLTAAAADTPAQQVARLLREGRGAEVTDDLYAAADPQELHRLYESGATGADMPMDTPSRMARADDMGLTSEGYHGTTAATDFQEFVPSERGRIGPGVYFSPNERLANVFAGADQASIMGKEEALPNARVIPVRISNAPADEAARFEARALRGTGESDAAVYQDVFGSRGFDGVSVEGQRTIVDPSNIRSRFARFDPRLAHLRNLNAANASPTLGLLATQAGTEQDPLANLRNYVAQYGLLAQ